jgi:hypothetical protein
MMKKQSINLPSMRADRQLRIPGDVPEDFANAVVTLLLLGIAAAHQWDLIYHHPPEISLSWIESILKINDTSAMTHTDLDWWKRQLRGH